MKNIIALIAALMAAGLALAGTAFAQTANSTDKPKRIFFREIDGPEIDGKVVKNAPYTANATTETTQTLADGSHIVNTTTASLARDSEGRTRREESGPKVGNLQANAPRMITINDPVAHLLYATMDKKVDDGVVVATSTGSPESGSNRVFIHRMEQSADNDGAQVTVGTGMGTGMGMGGGMSMHKTIMVGDDDQSSAANVQHESLGTQVIEGVNANGVRDTRTIPAGAIGNEKPIVITSETWISPDLQVIVLSKRNDPRFGETVYKLTDISRNEPDPSLFQIPSNAKKEPAIPSK